MGTESEKNDVAERVFRAELTQKAALVEQELQRLMDTQAAVPPRLREAMRYMLQGGGKRIRSVMVLWCCELTAGHITEAARFAAAAIEMVHTYSLIHDDLPAMDNDDMRRGRPSCHKQFDEATAILAGDGLLTLAFEVPARYISDPLTAVRIIRTLAEAAGPAGMIAGQMADLESQNVPGTMERLRYIHIHKTAKMFSAAAGMGAIAGNASEQDLSALLQYGLKIGLGFQIADDLLDVTASSEQLGKTAGKDAAQSKLTYPSLVGMDESRLLLRRVTEEAVAAIEPFGPRADLLRHLALEMLNRKK
jgi:geranylgeranyl diphosphate synthase type II